MDYLRIRLSRTTRVTLSLPGIARALKAGRLTGATVFLAEVGIWVPLLEHPGVKALGRFPVPVAPEIVHPAPDEVKPLSAWRQHLRGMQRWAAALSL